MINLTNDNFLLYAMKCYNSPNCIMSEFESDLKRLKYIKRLIRKYKLNGELKEQLLLNHLIILSNVFGVEHSVRILFFKLDKDYYSVLKTFLLFINHLPKVVYGINNINIDTSTIQIDLNISRKLIAIYKKH